MNPGNPQQPQTNTSDLQKLEEDLKKLEQENKINNGSQTMVNALPSTDNKPPVNFPLPDKPVKKGLPLIQFAILLVVSAILATLCYVLFMQVNNKINILSITPKGCTAEAKLCPDGSGVGRTGPNCEFAACPTVTATPDSTADWKVYTNTKYGFNFKYPEDFSSIDCLDNVQLLPTSDAKTGIDCGFLDSKWFSVFISTIKDQPVTSKDGYLDLTEYVITKDILTVASQSATKYTFTLKPGAGAGAWDSWYEKVDFTKNNYFYSITIKDRSWLNNFDQILSTFKFTSSGSEIIPSDISDLFSMVNKGFSSNIVPSSEDSFYSPSGMINRSSWKLDLSSVVKNKEQINILHAILNKQLNYDPSNSADGVQGSFEAYNNSQIQCYLVLGTSNYLSCTTK